MAIRYDKNLNQEINKTIKNFNQKIARLEKMNKQLLPEKITKKELKESVYTRQELKRKLKELKRFSIRDIENVITTKSGLTISKYELINLKKESARVKANLTRQINKMKSTTPKVFGKKQTATFSEMGDIEYLNLLARKQALTKNVQKLNKSEYERYKKLVAKTGKNQQYMKSVFKENYFEMLTDLAYYFNYDNEKLELLKKKLMNLDPNDFLKLFKEDKSIRAILDYYPMVTNTFNAINPDDIKDDVTGLYDNLINNIDEIIKDYE